MFLSQNYMKRLDNSAIEIVTLKPENISNHCLSQEKKQLDYRMFLLYVEGHSTVNAVYKVSNFTTTSFCF